MRAIILWVLVILIWADQVHPFDLQCEKGEREYCVCEKISKNTNCFTNFYQENQGNPDSFFDKNTFGIDLATQLGLDPCTPTSRYLFKKYVDRSNIKCTGPWCVNGEFKCQQGDSRNCYNMEHIFAKGEPNFSMETKNALANLVYAAGSWNQQLGTSIRQGRFGDELNEKTQVYGKNMIAKIKSTLEACSKKSSKRYFNDVTNCSESCTCNSTEALDILCSCDYEESGFDRASCDNSNSCTPFQTSPMTWIAIASIVLNIVIIFGIVAYIIYSKRSKQFDPADYGF